MRGAQIFTAALLRFGRGMYVRTCMYLHDLSSLMDERTAEEEDTRTCVITRGKRQRGE